MDEEKSIKTNNIVLESTQEKIKKLKFFTQEWADKVKEEINLDTDFKEASVGFNSKVMLKLYPDIEKGYPEEIKLFIDFRDTQVVEATIGKDEECEYVIGGNLDIWKEIAKGKIPITKAVLLKKVDFIGSLATAFKYLKAINIVIKTLGKIETKF